MFRVLLYQGFSLHSAARHLVIQRVPSYVTASRSPHLYCSTTKVTFSTSNYNNKHASDESEIEFQYTSTQQNPASSVNSEQCTEEDERDVFGTMREGFEPVRARKKKVKSEHEGRSNKSDGRWNSASNNMPSMKVNRYPNEQRNSKAFSQNQSRFSDRDYRAREEMSEEDEERTPRNLKSFSHKQSRFSDRDCREHEEMSEKDERMQRNRISFSEKQSRFSDRDHREEMVDEDEEITRKQYQRSRVNQRNERDVFGQLADEDEYGQSLITDEKLKQLDLEEEEVRPQRKRNKIETIHWYARQIERMAKRGQIYEAVEMLETRMLKEDRLMPNVHHFSALIGGLGRVGYHRKAYKMYNLMKKLHIEPDGPTYTGLFNSFANTPSEHKEEALEKAKRLHLEVRQKEIDLNVKTYNAMVKAYGMLGEVMLAFSVVDEMSERGEVLDSQTFACLLIACVSDKEAGFKHAIEVWRRYRLIVSKRRKRTLKFDAYLYNLLLRSCRDCGVGGEEFIQELIKRPSGAKQKLLKNKTPQLPEHTENLVTLESAEMIGDGLKSGEVIQGDSNTTEKSLTPSMARSSVTTKVPNILNPQGYFGDIVRLENLDSGTSRLALLGGPSGILSHMHKDGVKPDIKTFSLLLDLIPSTREAEQELIRVMQKERQKPNIDLLNLVIRRCSLRQDSEGTAEMLALMGKLEYQPTLMTFGCLAMGCRGLEQGRQLLDDMDSIGMVPNPEIFNILAYQSNNNYTYKSMLLRCMKEVGVAPEELFIKRMEDSLSIGRKKLVKLDRGELHWPERDTERFRKSFGQFEQDYKGWLLRMKIVTKPHPWHMYRNPPPVDIEEEQENEAARVK